MERTKDKGTRASTSTSTGTHAHKRFEMCGSSLHHLFVCFVLVQDSRLLALLLSADIERFWLPCTDSGDDALEKAYVVNDRVCTKLVGSHVHPKQAVA